MCGYINDCADDASSEDVLVQFQSAMDNQTGQRYLKIYTSGSFLDDDEIAAETGASILTLGLSRADRVLIESRPEFVTEKNLGLLPDPGRIEIAMGLESANDKVLRNAINKKMDFGDFQRASDLCRDTGIATRAYTLLKPPFLTEKEAVQDAVSTAEAAASLVETISLNPLNVQRNTLVEFLWRRGEFRPPWLWSVLDVIGRASVDDTRLVISTAGAGSRRGAHNCGQCDSAIIDYVREFSKDNTIKAPEFACDCREQWLDLLEVQGPLQSSVDPLAFYDR